MKKPLQMAGTPAEKMTVLSVSPIDGDHTSLKRIFDLPEWAACMDSKPLLRSALTFESAMPWLRENRIPVVLSERDLVPGTWIDVLSEIVMLPNPPLLVVTSRLADESLWSEALNLGAYDVLAKPFRNEEVIRVLSLACLHWKHRHKIQPDQRAAMRMAAS